MRRMAVGADVKNYVLKFFEERPKATIFDCVREGLKSGFALTPAIVSIIRRDKRKNTPKETPAVTAPPSVPTPKPTIWNKYEIPVEEKKMQSTIAERRKYFDDLVMANPAIGIRTAIEEVKKKFGTGVDPKYALKTLALARELAKPPEPKKQEPINLKKEAEVVYIVEYGSESWSVEKATDDVHLQNIISRLVSQNVPLSDIRVYKHIKVDIQVNVDIKLG